MEITDILLPEAVISPLRVQSKKRLFQEIAQGAVVRFRLDEQATLSALLERESLGPTGVGRGIAIPHARVPGLARVKGMFLRLETPVDFGSIDRKPVDLVFVLLAPEDAGAEHLKALARVSRLLRSDDTCAKIRSTHDAQAIFAILTAEETSKAA
ncbi:PTS IIA-like nitrogen regulatory protein PtsN [Halovulum dunhuangense]|uniref:PTS IIA-like nitrogen regulatory protein PtsN n=1 Tax=Halovulum dunhuangense TaxID=1505036 RepID=A0A849L070_9RHOB|nr:PTS IIA-like nitrogen regulatory protein PtsN [Halovulum dunhuangense]NNU79380.1 PTS IIA-like nitrogen regulatory protein PtsN [Halovulum dunhuangense]